MQDVNKLRAQLKHCGIETEGISDEEIQELVKRFSETFAWKVHEVMNQLRIAIMKFMDRLKPLIDIFKSKRRKMRQLMYRKKRSQAKRLRK